MAQRPPADSEHVRLDRVTKTFGGSPAVVDVTLVVAEGAFTTLLGPSGCGKTTTLRMIAGFYDPDRGEIYVRGRPQRGVPPHRRPVSIVFQDYALFPHMTVFDNVAYGLRVRRLAPAVVRQKVGAMLDLLDLGGLAGRYPHELSGGQQQRVALARSLVIEPEVLLMDEPLSNLDAALRVRVRGEIRELQRRLGITTIYVTHDREEALGISDQVAVMYEGRLLQVGTPEDLYFRPGSQHVAGLVGDANFLPGEVAAQRGSQLVVRIAGVEMPAAGVPPAGRTAVTVLVRPDWWTPVTAAGHDAGLRGEVRAREFRGQVTRYWVYVPALDRTVVVDDATGVSRPEGTAVALVVRGRPPYVVPDTL
jgi:ABC-type Fe3+/spermidine/putrescine transport system ATPase subunit